MVQELFDSIIIFDVYLISKHRLTPTLLEPILSFLSSERKGNLKK